MSNGNGNGRWATVAQFAAATAAVAALWFLADWGTPSVLRWML
ncbi:hypothetical protein SAMN05216223_106427 [Actinacidiphila yanglinensis]|uniref:Uncharacterized protein n=1 Tax=Actinacidiphila yanglinensis TaxID=310779 RepID=A0A1H6BCD5_9ACTN|nr:hypothetical protein [Actinacidiphila yanglinensis]SEG58418.1 hypothetical protein SAMN05216223_106427 [Actinacidiphila yanglinensis]